MTAVPLRFVKNEWRLTMMTSFVGVDLHRNNFTYCIRENGEEKKIGKCEISDRQHVYVLPFPESSCGTACSGESVAV